MIRKPEIEENLNKLENVTSHLKTYDYIENSLVEN